MNNYLLSGSVKMYVVCSRVSIYHIRIIFFCTKLWKQWYLIETCFVLGNNFLESATAIKLLFYLDTLQKTYVFGICISKIKYNSFINPVKGITLCIPWINAIYSASVVIEAIYVCNLLHHNTVHTADVTTYPIHDIEFSALSESAWSHPLEKLASM